MKKGIKALLSGLVIAALTVSMLGYITRLVERKTSYSRYSSFYAQKADVDVLFLGSSHVSYNIAPMELWQDHGIASYNMGIEGARIPMSYWALQNTLDHMTPKLVVMDCYNLSADRSGCETAEQTHIYFDTLPLSANKLRAVWSVVGKEDHRLAYIWDLIAYHDRWSQIGREDFQPYVRTGNGGLYVTDLAEVETYQSIDDSRMMEGETVGVQYLRKIIETCQEKGIEILLTYNPFPADEARQLEANRVPVIAAEYGIDYIDYLKIGVVDTATDYNDTNHLNVSGARKLTDHLGRYIMEHYDIPDRREDPGYADWYEDYEEYTQYKITVLAAQTELKNYLMLLQDKHLSACVYLAGEGPWREDGLYSALLENMGIAPQALPEEPALAVVDNMSGKTAYLTEGGVQDTAFGRVELARTEDEKYMIRINGETALELSPEADAGAAVIDNAGGAVATTSQFSIADVSVGKIN